MGGQRVASLRTNGEARSPGDREKHFAAFPIGAEVRALSPLIAVLGHDLSRFL